MERSLTVLLPVHDAQSTLADTVAEVLESAADLTDRFELLIIDDGSTDATCEVAHDLAHDYPQVRLLRHSCSLGKEAALRTGLAESQGEVVVWRDGTQSSPSRFERISRPARPNYLSRLQQFVDREVAPVMARRARTLP